MKTQNNGNCSQGDLCQHGVDYNSEEVTVVT